MDFSNTIAKLDGEYACDNFFCKYSSGNDHDFIPLLLKDRMALVEIARVAQIYHTCLLDGCGAKDTRDLLSAKVKTFVRGRQRQGTCSMTAWMTWADYTF